MSKEIKTKEFPFTLVKMDETEEGTFTGYASVFDMVDSYGDSVAKGAFRKTLRENEFFPMLWSHLVNEPIGTISGKEDKTGLAVKGKLNLEVQRAKEIRSLMKQGAIKGLSIGYQTQKEDVDRENGTRILKEIKLWEISPVVFQACPGAFVDGVKSDEPIEAKPYPNEHSCRLQNPDNFSEFRRGTRKHEGKEYSVIFGKPKEGEGWEEQAYRYNKDTWTAAEAKGHCKDHKGSFEAASGKCLECGADYDEIALLEEPGKPTQGEEPQTDTSKPEHLHLLEQFRDNIRELKNLMEGQK
jgi:HK97 family phage prohead protease